MSGLLENLPYLLCQQAGAKADAKKQIGEDCNHECGDDETCNNTRFFKNLNDTRQSCAKCSSQVHKILALQFRNEHNIFPCARDVRGW